MPRAGVRAGVGPGSLLWGMESMAMGQRSHAALPQGTNLLGTCTVEEQRPEKGDSYLGTWQVGRKLESSVCSFRMPGTRARPGAPAGQSWPLGTVRRAVCVVQGGRELSSVPSCHGTSLPGWCLQEGTGEGTC